MNNREKIFLINHSVQNCGVYQYGKRLGMSISDSKKYDFIYLEINSKEDLIENIKRYQPSCIIYNFLPVTMPWLNAGIVDNLSQSGIKQSVIIHNSEFTFFDYFIHQNPYHGNINSNNFSLKRPLFKYDPPENLHEEKNGPIQIGTFGFGGSFKNIDKICELVVSQFNNEFVRLNIHLTVAHFGGESNFFDEIKNKCFELTRNTSTELIFTNNFLDDKKMLDFLYKNDLNIFFYDSYSFYNGISSVTDYALSVKKPIAICRSNMFSHLHDINPSICVEDTPLKEIIKNGISPLQKKYEEWSNEKITENIDNIIDSILGKVHFS